MPPEALEFGENLAKFKMVVFLLFENYTTTSGKCPLPALVDNTDNVPRSGLDRLMGNGD